MTPSHLRSLPAFVLTGGLLATLLTTGCVSPSVSSSAHATIPVPEQWTQPSAVTGSLDTASLTQWWTRFNDPVLNDLIVRALASSPDIATALARIDESRARHGVQRSTLFPTLSASASGRESRTRDRTTDTTARGENYSASLDASWQVDLFGVERRNLAATAADLQQTVENYHAAQVSLAAEIASAYVSLRAAELQRDVIRRNLVNREETTQIAEWREQAGSASALETQQALSTLEQSRASLPSLEQTITQTRNQLTLLSGLTPGTLNELLSTAQGTIPTLPDTLAIGIPADTLRQRPDVRAAESGVQAASARLSSANRARLPSLTLSGSVGVEALEAGKLTSPTAIISSLVASLAAPIFDAGRISNNILLQSSVERQALLTYQSSLLTALAEVENALVAIQRSAERLEILTRAVSSAQLAETLASQQYEAGQVDLLTLLEAQRTLLSVEEQQALTRADQATAHVQLYKALGGGWSQI